VREERRPRRERSRSRPAPRLGGEVRRSVRQLQSVRRLRRVPRVVPRQHARRREREELGGRE
jgi:hypothetical protein